MVKAPSKKEKKKNFLPFCVVRRKERFFLEMVTLLLEWIKGENKGRKEERKNH